MIELNSNNTLLPFILSIILLMYACGGGSAGTRTEETSLFSFDSVVEENDHVLTILGKLAHLYELQFLPPFLKWEEKRIPCSTGMRAK